MWSLCSQSGAYCDSKIYQQVFSFRLKIPRTQDEDVQCTWLGYRNLSMGRINCESPSGYDAINLQARPTATTLASFLPCLKRSRPCFIRSWFFNLRSAFGSFMLSRTPLSPAQVGTGIVIHWDTLPPSVLLGCTSVKFMNGSE